MRRKAGGGPFLGRYIIIGLSRFGQLLVVAHTDRAEKTRIISARKATRQEKRFYEEGI